MIDVPRREPMGLGGCEDVFEAGTRVINSGSVGASVGSLEFEPLAEAASRLPNRCGTRRVTCSVHRDRRKV